MKKIRNLFLLCFLLCIFLSGCSKNTEDPFQITSAGGSVARINIMDYGCIDIKLFDELAPTAVEDFIQRSTEGYFDGKPFSSVIENYCIMAGEEDTSAGVGAEFGQEIQDNLYPIKGSVCLNDFGNGICADRFIIIGSDVSFLNELKELLEYKKITPEEYYKQAYGTVLSEEELSYFNTYGGAPWLTGHCIVFGQIYNGMEVLDAIMGVDTEGTAFTPKEDIIIDSIEILR